MKTLRPDTVLLFYDYPQVFLGRDSVDSRYVCMVTEENTDGPRYLCAPLSSSRVNELISGKLDLRTVYVSPELAEFHVAKVVPKSDGMLEMAPADFVSVPESLLPADGLLFEVIDEVAITAVEMNTTVSYVSLGVPEAEKTARIKSTTLSDFLNVFQSTLRNLARTHAKLLKRPLKRDDDSFSADVFGFAKGSFTVKFRTSYQGDMFGELPAFSGAMEILSEFLSLADDPELAMRYLQSVKGHTASSLIKLLEFLAQHSCPIKLEWAKPSMTSAIKTGAQLNEIIELVALCKQRSDLSIEEVVLTGRVSAADERNKTWKIVNEEDQEIYSGDVHPNSSVSLSGIVIGNARYEFVCEESIETIRGTGKELKQLQLRSVKKLS